MSEFSTEFMMGVNDMGRINAGKPSRDTETAAESLILNSLTSGTLIKQQEAAIDKSVTASLQSGAPPDENGERKFLN